MPFGWLRTGSAIAARRGMVWHRMALRPFGYAQDGQAQGRQGEDRARKVRAGRELGRKLEARRRVAVGPSSTAGDEISAARAPSA